MEMKFAPYCCGFRFKVARTASAAVLVGVVELVICTGVLCSLLSTFTSGLQATVTYGGAAARLTAVMLLFIGIKEKRHVMLIPHLTIQLCSIAAFLYPILSISRTPDSNQPATRSSFIDIASSGHSPSALVPTGPSVPPLFDLTFILCTTAVIVEVVFFLVILHAYFVFRRVYAMHRMRATEALLNSINNQWRSSSINVSNSLLVEMYPYGLPKNDEQRTPEKL